jgi:hypothetical protein
MISDTWAYRLDRVTWRVKIGNALHLAETETNVVAGCLPELIKIDGRTVQPDDSELAYRLASSIYDECARTELAGRRPPCPLCGVPVDGADQCRNPSCTRRWR